MHLWPAHDGRAESSEVLRPALRQRPVQAAAALIICSLALTLGLQRWEPERRTAWGESAVLAPAVRAERPPPPPAPPRLPRAELWNNGRPREVFATWYQVPEKSLAKNRAGPEELTAAHDRLPIGTLVRVTNLKNRKSALVRITDRGIRSKKVKLDLCKEAAEELGIVSKGVARVRMEVLAETPTSSGGESQTAAPQP